MARRHRTGTLVVAALLAAVVWTPPTVPGENVRTVAWSDELGPNARPGPLHYVALGDSFTSGEGDPWVDPNERRAYLATEKYMRCATAPVELRQRCAESKIDPDEVENAVGWLGDTGTDIAELDGGERRAADVADSSSFGGNNCHRSGHAYPVRVWGALDAENPEWGVTFAACSGALVEHFRTSFRGEPAQEAAFADGPADLVTLGFGGNDVGFGDLVKCALIEAGADRGLMLSLANALTEVDWCRRLKQGGTPERLAALRTDLERMYADVRATPGFLDGDATVIAVGYPRLFPADPPSSCSLGSAASIGHDSMVWLNGLADGIDGAVRDAARARGIQYVDTSDIIATPGSDGVRHDFCVDSGPRWVQRLVPSDLRRSMHPEFPYHERVAERVLACWRDRGTCAP